MRSCSLPTRDSIPTFASAMCARASRTSCPSPGCTSDLLPPGSRSSCASFPSRHLPGSARRPSCCSAISGCSASRRRRCGRERCWCWWRWRACASAWSRRAASWRSRLWLCWYRTRGRSSPWVRGCRWRVWARWSGRAARSLGRRASRASPRPHSPPRLLPRRSARSRSASWLASGPAHLIAAGAGLGLALLDLVARGAALVPGGHVVMVAGWRAALVWAAVAVAAWWLWNSPRRPWLIAARVAFVSTVFVTTTFRDVISLDDCRCLTVHFLDVGQGDAAALRTPNGRWIVIDGGPRTPERDAGRRVVVPFLRGQGVGRVAVLVATHGDADHLGGLPAVVEAFDPELVLEPGEPLGRPLYLEFLAGVEASGARWHPARAGDRVEVDGVVLEVLSPDSLWLRLPLDVNEHGVVLRVRYGTVRLLFQADAGLPVESRLVGTVGRVDLLKVGHHGSRSATSDEWLDELEPRTAVISVGRHNNYGHPAPDVLARLARHGVTVFRTDQSGTITFSTDGHGERIRSHHD